MTAASRHGSTAEIASVLAAEIAGCPAGRDAALSAAAVPAGAGPDPASWDAVVLGSAVYGGRWLAPAHDLAVRHVADLRRKPVWLFSSGPIGAPPFPPDEPYDVGTLTALLPVHGTRVLPGRLDPARLRFEERAMVTAMRAPVGDFRDWEAVRAWAREIAGVLAAEEPAARREPMTPA
ncbi:flavodoxin domain-containing protein [Geodermatophilus saharensis]|uniref:flavodoxin domain-containing protein n=1 Tax=Geodermatophilus saharensis TaxID=1137994 RepID=UPI001C3CE48A|nr:flavodoxin domain-containing protein [Geodermatophilus saharensis]